MRSALAQRSWREITRRRARSAFTVVTLAAAIVGLWLFAVPSQMDAAMADRVATDRPQEVLLAPGGVRLTASEIAGLRRLPNVEGLEARATFWTRIRAGGEERDVWVVGVDDLAHQEVNVVSVVSGNAPRGAAYEALLDPQDRRSGRLDAGIGDVVEVLSADRRFVPLRISGTGQTLEFSSTVRDDDPVIYVPTRVVNELGGFSGYTRIELRLRNHDDVSVQATIGRVRGALTRIDPAVFYNRLPVIRAAGDWPGREDFRHFVSLFWAIAFVSVLAAVVLVGTTMSTLVREQTREIGIMKAIGGRRVDVVRSFLRTTLLLAGFATALGIAAGLPLSYALVAFMSRSFQGVDPAFRVSLLALGLSLLVGFGATVVASTPGLLRASRLTVKDALESRGIEARFGTRRVDRVVAGARFLPRTAQLGLRNAARRKGRSAATAAQVALAVGMAVALGSVCITLLEVSKDASSRETQGDIALYSTGDGRALDAHAVDVIRSVEGVEAVQPVVYDPVAVGGVHTSVWGLPADPIYRYRLNEGRWFTRAEVAGHARVAVVGKALASRANLAPGDLLRLETLHGDEAWTVIGVDDHMVQDGEAVFAPITTAAEVKNLGEPRDVWVNGTSTEKSSLDRLDTLLQQALAREGYTIGADLRYVDRASQRAENLTIVSLIMLLGLPIVAVGLIGLVGAMTSNVIERSREIAVLRSIGARARNIRGIYRAEGIALALLGWLLGVAVGYVLSRVLMHAIGNAFHTSFTLSFPLWPLGAALAITVVVTLAVLHFPLRRACRLQPGAALRFD